MRLASLLLTALVAATGACRDTRHDARHDAPRDPAAGPRTHSTPGAEAGASADASAQLTRRITPAPEHQRWIRGGSERDTILSFPRTLAVDDNHLYVLDADTHALLALRLADGALDWRVGGPRDSTIAPIALTAAPSGRGVIVADAAHGRLVALGADGRPASAPAVAFAAAADARSLCALPDGSVLVAGADPAGALLRVARHAPSPERVPLPWPDLAARHRLAIQVTLASAPVARSPGCVVALALGRGFALYDGIRYVARERYVEPFDLPGVTTTVTGDSALYTRVERLDDSRLAARDVALSAARVAVAFDGSTAFRARVVDFYDRRTLDYASSLSFPGRIAAVADDGRTLYVAFMRRGRAAVAAYPYPAPPPPSPAARDSAADRVLTLH